MSHSDSEPFPAAKCVEIAWGNPLTWIALVGTGLLIGCLLLPTFQQSERRQKPSGYLHLKNIGLALLNYQDEWKSWPHDPRGPEYALYQLREMVEPTDFDIYPIKLPQSEAHWDDVQRTIVASDVWYWNPPPDTPIRMNRIIGVVPPSNEYPDVLHVLLMDASRHWLRVPRNAPDHRAYAGAWLLDPDSATQDEAIAEAWDELDVEPSQMPASSHMRGGSPDFQWFHGTIRCDAKYQDGLLSTRNWTCPQGTVTEAINRDANGLVTELHREPANWQSFWPTHSESTDP